MGVHRLSVARKHNFLGGQAYDRQTEFSSRVPTSYDCRSNSSVSPRDWAGHPERWWASLVVTYHFLVREVVTK